jgi:serine/threonine-protein kinase
MVMELLEGEDLEAVLRRGAVSVQTAVDWILQACEALAHLELHGLVHRDTSGAG